MAAETHEVFTENQALNRQQIALTAEVRPAAHPSPYAVPFSSPLTLLKRPCC